MERKRFYNNSIIKKGNTVIKESQWPIDQRAIEIITKEQPIFLPKVLDYSKYTITYEYIDGPAVGTYLKDIKASAQDVIEIFTYINDIWREFLNMSKRHLDDEMIYHNDLHLWNMVYKNKQVILTDLDSIVISRHVNLQTSHSYLFHQMEDILYARIQK